MSSTPRAPCRIIQWTSKFARRLVKRSLGGGVYAFSEMVDHMSMFRELYGHLLDLYPGMFGLEDCESLFTRLDNRKVITENILVRHFLAIQQAIDLKKLGNVYWLSCLVIPAGRLTKLKSDLVPLLRLLVSGSQNPGALLPLRGAAFCER